MKIVLLVFLINVGVFADYERENDTLIESKYHLQWQDTTAKRALWQEAVDICENSDFGGYNDWRLPNIQELRTIVDRYKQGLSIVEDFTNLDNLPDVEFKHWSSTTKVTNKANAYHINFMNGTVSDSVKYTNNHYVRCVRSF